MIAAYETDLVLEPAMVDIYSQLDDLERRLARGMSIIDERRTDGLPVQRYEDHWIALLREYEQLYDLQVAGR